LFLNLDQTLTTKPRRASRRKFPVTDVFSHIEVADGRIWMLPDGVECFAGDLSEEKKVVWAPPTLPRPRTCSHKSSMASPGGRSRARISWPLFIATTSAPTKPSMRETSHVTPSNGYVLRWNDGSLRPWTPYERQQAASHESDAFSKVFPCS
jgi:hypothetical protein